MDRGLSNDNAMNPRVDRPLVALGVGLLVAGLLVAGPSFAQDAVPCSEIGDGGPIIYGTGGSAQTPLISKAAVVLQTSDDPVHVVYKDDAGACTGIYALTGLGAATLTGNAKYWDDAGTQLSCALPLEGEAVDFASMGNGALLCPLVTDTSYLAGVVEVTGPISSVNVLVPNASSQQAISAEAFYLVYGFGAAAGVAPWTNADPAYYIHRNENSYVQLYLALASGIPVTKFYGVDAGSNTNSIAYLSALTDPEAGIGFASGEVADGNRATVRTLAWQHVGQNAAYWPDSTATAFDKINVRSGLYHLWGPGRFFAYEGGSEGSYSDSAVQVLLEYLSGTSAPAGASKSIRDVAIANKNVPTCAMYVTRDEDLGPMYAYEPEEPCHCYFEYAATGATSCDTCDESTPCASGTCRDGFCEEY
jgi:hypothetical protein